MSEALPNFCRWMSNRYGRGWEVRSRPGKGNITRDDFLAAKREYEALLGCRVYSPEYGRRFYDRTGPEIDAITLLPAPEGQTDSLR